ncbi:type II toxin-antitoxin system VapC family toxin [Natrarchaeobius oligotrophus]|uniref:PIN domain-containing protein n=1 Tax=Natrarchaeobius chitinivorans TaxID=1679083 RepID=A0A3N6NEZ9_NATCH|nr:type II toxin-antitoxin system VapC family toxin [Natrarchaeobius chitinivorans]RQG97502.1 PIN domain-containing protein [Natrarchaeobius chitinivorans]
MSEIVVDTSVVVKWYIPEQHYEAARALRDDYLDGEFDLVAPALMPFEAVNALKYSGHYDGPRLQEASKSLPEYGIDLIPFDNSGPVAEVATDLDITLYDASYIALAQKLDSVAYTADGKLLDDLHGDYLELAEHIRTYTS